MASKIPAEFLLFFLCGYAFGPELGNQQGVSIVFKFILKFIYLSKIENIKNVLFLLTSIID